MTLKQKTLLGASGVLKNIAQYLYDKAFPAPIFKIKKLKDTEYYNDFPTPND